MTPATSVPLFIAVFAEATFRAMMLILPSVMILAFSPAEAETFCALAEVPTNASIVPLDPLTRDAPPGWSLVASAFVSALARMSAEAARISAFSA